jgi:hypothetical protein
MVKYSPSAYFPANAWTAAHHIEADEFAHHFAIQKSDGSAEERVYLYQS